MSKEKRKLATACGSWESALSESNIQELPVTLPADSGIVEIKDEKMQEKLDAINRDHRNLIQEVLDLKTMTETTDWRRLWSWLRTQEEYINQPLKLIDKKEVDPGQAKLQLIDDFIDEIVRPIKALSEFYGKDKGTFFEIRQEYIFKFDQVFGIVTQKEI